MYKVTGKHTIASSVFYEHPYYDPKEIKNDVALVELPKEIGFDGKLNQWNLSKLLYGNFYSQGKDLE